MTFTHEYEPGEWTEDMTSDVLVEQFTFGELTEQGFDDATAGMAVGDEMVLFCHDASLDARWEMTVRRES